MIVPALLGGLGNQLFTIAAVYSKSLDQPGVDFGINYNLPHYAMQGESPLAYRDSFYKKIPSTDYTPSDTYNEQTWHYTPIPDIDDISVQGYFQSEKHFKHHSTEVKSLFEFPADVRERVDEKIKQYNKKIVGVHVRLGDYLRPDCRPIHHVCSKEYYERAVSNFNLDEYQVVVCTDNINAYRSYINLTNADVLEEFSVLESLYFLSICDSIVMSNSSFSWWGAYLGKQKEIVYAPSRWFGPNGPQNFQDIYMDNWKLIDT